jgi:hypothetical protein
MGIHAVFPLADHGTARARGERMSKLTKRVLGFLGVVVLLAGCAVDPGQGQEEKGGPTADEENLGQTEQALKWTRPKCMDDTWVCGKCICNACNVEDCRNAATVK